MYSSTNNGVFEWGGDRKQSGQYTSTSQQQPGLSELHWLAEPRRESYINPALASTTSSWPSTTSLDSPFSMFGGVWPGDHYVDKTHLGLPFNAPCANVDGSRTNPLMGMEVAAPLSEQSFPVVQRALLTPHPCLLPPPNWTQAPSPRPRWQAPSSRDHPVRTASQHGGPGSSTGSLGTRPNIHPFQLTASSVVTGPSESRMMPTGCPPSTATAHSARHSLRSDPVPVAPAPAPRPRGERWDLSLNANTFQCLWTSGETRCTALIAGDRRSVTSHLRDVHHFTCDGQMIACAWDWCGASMQRRNVPRHIVACHLEIKVPCPQCGMALSRSDASKKHLLACTGKSPAAVEAGEYFR